MPLRQLHYSGGRRVLLLYLDRETSAALDQLCAERGTSPEAVAVAELRRALVGGA